ncbi:glucocorticoid modulatory element-binding protein 1-like isoform X2 [Echeneis naucrates]|uniref:glucocorticoid modulatory element-binding protein 1-like isoform X2 n=1 Tax=Echeneis naucrates TaxID=173247 RepID=UPI001114092F|nr:glucocorticoid modulatory element-binding protein 1-like isoform X2 [Echeneis naucrates]
MLLRQMLPSLQEVSRSGTAHALLPLRRAEDELSPAVKIIKIKKKALWGGAMAGSEVNVSPGELIMVKDEEGESSGNNHKTQVILHLQPLLHGVNDDIADTGTTVLAIETHHDSKAEGEEIEYGYPITCGDSRAVLLFKKFVCPGINVRCVKFNDQLISPKQFVHLAGKATLKDWKRAIRLGGVMLRKMMDSGQIDFYQHDTLCSNTCRSTKFDVLINSTRLPPGTSVQPSPSCLALDPLGGQVPPLTEVMHDTAEVEEAMGHRFSATAEWSPGPARRVNSATANGHAAKRKRAEMPDGVLKLWQGVADSGLMGHVLSGLQTEFLTALKGVEVRSEKANLQETDAILLNSLCEMFGLVDSVKQTLDLTRSQNEDSKIKDSIFALDEILEERQKQGFEKSTCYKHTSLKHFRRQRQNPSSNPTQTVLAPVKTSPLTQPISVSGLSAESFTQLTGNPRLFTHFYTSTDQHQHTTVGSDSESTTLEWDHEVGETGSRDKAHLLGHKDTKKEDTSGIYEESGQRNVKSQGDHRLKNEEDEETEGLHDTEKIIIEGNVSKKHKSK